MIDKYTERISISTCTCKETIILFILLDLYIIYILKLTDFLKFKICSF